MDTFRGGVSAADVPTGNRRFLGLEPSMLMTILVALVIIILLVLLFNMSSGSDSSGSGATPQTAFFNPLNTTMRNNSVRAAPVVTTATTTRAV